MISGIIKVKASVISWGRKITLWLPHITKSESNYFFIIHCFMENKQILLCEMQIQGQKHQAASSLETIQVLKSLETIQVFCNFSASFLYSLRLYPPKVLRMRKPSHSTCCLGCEKLSLVNSTFAFFSQRCARYRSFSLSRNKKINRKPSSEKS